MFMGPLMAEFLGGWNGPWSGPGLWVVVGGGLALASFFFLFLFFFSFFSFFNMCI